LRQEQSAQLRLEQSAQWWQEAIEEKSTQVEVSGLAYRVRVHDNLL